MKPTSPCPEFETRLPEYLEGILEAPDRPAMANHLAACARCQEFAKVWRGLDASLARGIAAPRLSPDFDARLLERIRTEARLLSPEEREARKRTLETEFSDRAQALRRRAFSVAAVLDGVGYWALASAFGLAAWQWLPKLTEWSRVLLPANLPQGLLSGVLTALAILIAGGLAFSRPARRLRLSP